MGQNELAQEAGARERTLFNKTDGYAFVEDHLTRMQQAPNLEGLQAASQTGRIAEIRKFTFDHIGALTGEEIKVQKWEDHMPHDRVGGTSVTVDLNDAFLRGTANTPLGLKEGYTIEFEVEGKNRVYTIAGLYDRERGSERINERSLVGPELYYVEDDKRHELLNKDGSLNKEEHAARYMLWIVLGEICFGTPTNTEDQRINRRHGSKVD